MVNVFGNAATLKYLMRCMVALTKKQGTVHAAFAIK